MARRTRQRSQSDSSVETIDQSDVHWKQERSVFRNVGKEVNHNNWPTFEMIDVTIYGSDGRTMRSGLEAMSHGPLIVRGIVLIEEPEQKARLIQRVKRSTPMEIAACKLYSIGETETRRPIIWMGGDGGWYEIKPSAAYLPIFDTMCEAVTLYYHMFDIHQEIYKPQKKKKTVQRAEIRDVFPKYAQAVGDGSTWQDVCDRCCEHGAFLLERFEEDTKLGESPGLPWSKSVIYSWLTSQKANFPKIPAIRSASSEESGKEASRSPPTARHARRSSPVLQSIEAKPARKATPAVVAGPSQTSSAIDSRPVLQIEPLADPFNDPPLRTLLAALEASFGELMNEKTSITPKKLLNNFYFKYKFPTYKPETKSARGEGVHRRPVEEVFHRNAKDLLKLLDRDKYGSIYDWLTELSTTPLRLLALKPSDFPYRIIPRDTTARKPQAGQPGATAALLALRRRSSTRPQTPPRAGKSTKTPGRSSKSVLRPIKSTKKRVRGSSGDDDSDESENSPSKKPQYLSDEMDSNMDLDMPDVEVDSDSSDADVASDGHTPTSKPAPMMKLFSERVSTVIPRGNAKSWLCTEGDCGFAVRSGDDLADRVTMKEHMDEHRRASRMDIIMSEQRAHLPISNLLERVQAMGQAAIERETKVVNGQIVKEPIKKKLLV